MKVVIIGAGTTAIYAADILTQDRNITIAGFVGTEEEESKLEGKQIYQNLTFLGSVKLFSELMKDDVFGFIAAIGINNIRENRYYEAITAGLLPINAISQHSKINSSVQLGKGVIISPGCIISHGVEIGNNTIINPGTIIGIDAKISENCHIGTGCIVEGLCEIGRNVSLGPRSTIKSYLNIGKNQIIKSGDFVDNNLQDIIRK